MPPPTQECTGLFQFEWSQSLLISKGNFDSTDDTSTHPDDHLQHLTPRVLQIMVPHIVVTNPHGPEYGTLWSFIIRHLSFTLLILPYLQHIRVGQFN